MLQPLSRWNLLKASFLFHILFHYNVDNSSRNIDFFYDVAGELICDGFLCLGNDILLRVISSDCQRFLSSFR